MPSLFLAFGEDLRPDLDSGFPRVDFELSFGNESFLTLWLALVANTRLVELLDRDLLGGPSSSAKLLTYNFGYQ